MLNKDGALFGRRGETLPVPPAQEYRVLSWELPGRVHSYLFCRGEARCPFPNQHLTTELVSAWMASTIPDRLLGCADASSKEAGGRTPEEAVDSVALAGRDSRRKPTPLGDFIN